MMKIFPRNSNFNLFHIYDIFTIAYLTICAMAIYISSLPSFSFILFLHLLVGNLLHLTQFLSISLPPLPISTSTLLSLTLFLRLETASTSFSQSHNRSHTMAISQIFTFSREFGNLAGFFFFFKQISHGVRCLLKAPRFSLCDCTRRLHHLRTGRCVIEATLRLTSDVTALNFNVISSHTLLSLLSSLILSLIYYYSLF